MDVINYSNQQYVTRATIAWIKCGENAAEYWEECAAYCMDAPTTMPTGHHVSATYDGKRFAFAPWIAR
jgi:hypothetical protein